MQVRRITYKTPDYEKMLDLRYRILRKPLGMVLSEEEKHLDEGCQLLGCFDGDILAGCLVLQGGDDGWVKLRQAAVDEGRQGQGVGQALLKKSYDVAKSEGYSRMYCHARDTAVGFYEKDGWKIVGDAFDEVGIVHYRMERASL